MAYNHEEFIEKCLHSIFEQTLPRGEHQIIILHDLSSDRTGEIIGRCIEGQRNVLLLNTDRHLGISKNFMRCEQHVRGSYVSICDGDDFWTSRERLVQLIEEQKASNLASTLFTNYVTVDAKDNIVEYMATRYDKWRMPQIIKYENIFCHDLRIKINTLLISKRNFLDCLSSLKKLNYLGVSTYDIFICLLLARCSSFVYVDENMSAYRVNNQSFTSNPSRLHKAKFSWFITWGLILLLRKPSYRSIRYVLKRLRSTLTILLWK